MSWPFSGSWEGRGAQDLSVILSSLILALNERQEQMNITETLFNYSGGTKIRPSSSDLSGLAVDGSFSRGNLALLIDSIIDLFTSGTYPGTPTIGGTGAWWNGTNPSVGPGELDFNLEQYTASTMQDIVGNFVLGNYSLDVTLLDSLRDAFDLMIRVAWRPVVEPEPNRFLNGLGSSNHFNTDGATELSESWEAAKTQFGSIQTGPIDPGVEFRNTQIVSSGPDDFSYYHSSFVTTQQRTLGEMQIGNIPGTHFSSSFWWEGSQRSLGDTYTPISVTVDDTIVVSDLGDINLGQTFPPGNTGTGWGVTTISPTWPPSVGVSNLSSFTFEFPLASSVPMAPFPDGTNGNALIIATTNVPFGVPGLTFTIQTDLTSLLTDQA